MKTENRDSDSLKKSRLGETIMQRCIMRRCGFTLVQSVIVLVLVVFAGLVIFPVFSRTHHPQVPPCRSHLKQISLGIKQYAQDFDERFPLVSISQKKGWADSLYPYLKTQRVFYCPKNPYPNENAITKTIDYFYNARLAGGREGEFNAVVLTVMSGDGLFDAGTNAHIEQLPFEWSRTEASPSRRHLKGANYAFADGHVKWYKPEKITTKPTTAGKPTFSIR